MPIEILMPALSPTMEEGAIAKWHVKPGDMVSAGQVIAEIETDKATMEVEAVDEGEVEAILAPEGSQNVKVNTPIARLKGEGAAAPAPKPVAAAAAPAPAPQRAEAPKAAAVSGGARLFASPLARRLAGIEGIDLSAVAGSGPHGRVVAADVRAAKGAPQAAPAASESRALTTQQASAPAPVKSLEQMGILPNSYRLVPLDMMRKTIARRMTESFRDIPHFPLTIDLEIDKLLRARADINERFGDLGVKVSVNDFVIRASALALMRVPESNASYTPDGIALHHHADIAVAVAIPGGLITPIIRGAEQKGLAAISQEMQDLAKRAREKKLKPEEYQGGTFSISNLGMFGIKSFASILNEPHGMIMSVGAGEQRPIVRDGQVAAATVMTITLTCDHRVVDGAIGAAFLKAFRGFLEDPMTMLL